MLSFRFPPRVKDKIHGISDEAEGHEGEASPDPREERTLGSQVDPGVAIRSFVSRFGLFLRELEMSRVSLPSEPSALSLPLGIAFVLFGVLANVLASWRHVRYIRELNRGSLIGGRPSGLAVVLALLLAAAGLLMAFYLGTTRAHEPLPRSLQTRSTFP